MPDIASCRPFAFVLAVRDLAATAAYSQGRPGFAPQLGDAADWRLLSRGSARFMIGHCPDTPPARDIDAHSYVACREVDDLDGVHAGFADRGAIVLQPPCDKPCGMREMLVGTPDGHHIMIGQSPGR
jgi:hypothetical protein